MHAGEVAVEHQHVVPGDARLLVPVVAVVGDIDRHALGAQSPRDRVGQRPLVLHHQDPHVTLPLRTRTD